MNVRNSVKAALVTAATVAAIGSTPDALADQSANLTVTTTIPTICTIAAATLTFPNYDPIVSFPSGTPDQTSQTMAVTCTNGSTVNVILDQGQNHGNGSTAAAPVRNMLITAGNSGSLLSYQLYSDNAYSTVWGGTNATGNTYTGTGSAGVITVYGSIPGGQTTAYAGTYQDVVSATVEF